MYIDKLDGIVNKYNNSYHSSIKMRPVELKLITEKKENNEKDSKFKTGGAVRILRYKNILQKVTLQIDLEKFLWLKKLKMLCCGHMLLMILMIRNCWNILLKRIAKHKSKRV